MSLPVLELSEEHLQKIGTFVRSHFHEWLLEDRRVSGDVLTDQLNRIENALEASIVLTRERFELMVYRFEAMDKKFEDRFAAIDRRFELVEQRFELVDQRFDQMNARMNRQFAVLLSVSGTLFAGIVGLLLQGFLP